MLEEFRNVELKYRSVNTVSAYMSDLKQFLGFVNKDFAEIVEDDIEKFKVFLFGQKMKPKTVNRKLMSIKRYLDFLKIPIKIRFLKIQNQEKLEEMLTNDEFKRMIKYAEKENDYRAVAVFQGLILTGARVSELIQLTTDDLKGDVAVIIGKGGKYRELDITKKAKEYFYKYVYANKLKSGDFLFKNKTNNHVMSRQSIHNLVKKYAGKARIKLTHAHAHNFRHLYALNLRESGWGIEEIADMLGHSNINTTRIYTRKTKEEYRKKLERDQE